MLSLHALSMLSPVGVKVPLLQINQTGDAKLTNELLEYLVQLPLAIRQTSAFMARNKFVTVARYLEICKSSDQNLIGMLSESFEDQDRYDNTTNAVALTWHISFEQIARDAPLAASYLETIVYYAEKNIPVSLLPDVDNKLVLQKYEAVSILKGYSFILERGTMDRFDIHRLVRLAMRNWVRSKKQQSRQITKAVCQLSKSFPWPTHENQDLWTSYLPHAQAVLELRGDCTEKENLGLLQRVVARAYDSLGKYKKAEIMYRETLALNEEVLGPENPSTLASMNNLASVLNKRGKYEEAERMHRKTLGLTEKVLGPKNPDTFTSMNNLASVLDSQGKYEEAEHIHWTTFALSKMVLGQENPSIFNVMNNLALMLDRQGKYEEAEEMCRTTLKLSEKVLGQENPDTLISINNLALMLYKQGKYEEAEQMLRTTLALREKVLGLENPDTLSSIKNLVLLLHSQGKYEEAEEMHQKILALIVMVRQKTKALLASTGRSCS